LFWLIVVGRYVVDAADVSRSLQSNIIFSSGSTCFINASDIPILLRTAHPFSLATVVNYKLIYAHQPKSLPTATSELHALLALPALSSVPLLVLANKNDLPEAVGVDDLIGEMRLGEIGGRVVSVSNAQTYSYGEK